MLLETHYEVRYMKVFVIRYYVGNYSDYSSGVVCIRSTKELAEETLQTIKDYTQNCIEREEQWNELANQQPFYHWYTAKEENRNEQFDLWKEWFKNNPAPKHIDDNTTYEIEEWDVDGPIDYDF